MFTCGKILFGTQVNGQKINDFVFIQENISVMNVSSGKDYLKKKKITSTPKLAL